MSESHSRPETNEQTGARSGVVTSCRSVLLASLGLLEERRRVERHVGAAFVPSRDLIDLRPCERKVPPAAIDRQESARPRPRSGDRGKGTCFPGNCGSGNAAFTLSRGSCGATPYTSSGCSPLSEHALVPLGFRRQVSPVTQGPPYESFPRVVGISHSPSATRTACSSVNARPSAHAEVNASTPRAAWTAARSRS
jgi:hypothetical protein